MRLYYLVGHLLRPFGLASLYLYSILTKTARVRVIVQNEKDEILLLQTWLGSGRWGLPGGGVHRSEDPKMAAQRELREETGVVVSVDALQQLLVFRSLGHDEVVFTLSIDENSAIAKSPNKYEVRDIAWFPSGELPNLEPLAQRVMRVVARSRSV